MQAHQELTQKYLGFTRGMTVRFTAGNRQNDAQGWITRRTLFAFISLRSVRFAKGLKPCRAYELLFGKPNFPA